MEEADDTELDKSVTVYVMKPTDVPETIEVQNPDGSPLYTWKLDPFARWLFSQKSREWKTGFVRTAQRMLREAVDQYAERRNLKLEKKKPPSVKRRKSE